MSSFSPASCRQASRGWSETDALRGPVKIYAQNCLQAPAE